MKLSNEFEPIRQWAEERGIFKEANIYTQYFKLLEEINELKMSFDNEDKEEFIDAIGDCIIVLTNMAKLGGVDVEVCINSAYNEIKNRKGKMINGTFVKEK